MDANIKAIEFVPTLKGVGQSGGTEAAACVAVNGDGDRAHDNRSCGAGSEPAAKEGGLPMNGDDGDENGGAGTADDQPSSSLVAAAAEKACGGAIGGVARYQVSGVLARGENGEKCAAEAVALSHVGGAAAIEGTFQLVGEGSQWIASNDLFMRVGMKLLARRSPIFLIGAEGQRCELRRRSALLYLGGRLSRT